MIFLECDLALYKRLTGYPLDSKGRPQLDANGVPKNREVIGPPRLNAFDRVWDAIKEVFIPVYPVLPSYGIRIPVLIGPGKMARGLKSDDPAALRSFTSGFEPANFRQVPVFDQNISDRNPETIWPCVTFRWINTEFPEQTQVYHDPFGAPNSTSYQDPTSPPIAIKNAQGNVVANGFTQNTQRPHPEAWNAIYAITAWSTNEIELALICDAIMALFPGKGAINVELQDGTTHACDMLLQRVETLDEGGDRIERGYGPNEDRPFARSFVYLIETYRDNTLNQFGTQGSQWATRSNPAIVQRLLELDTLMGIVADASTDMDLQELLPFTPGGS